MNIVLIFADQMHKFALGRVSDFVSTPNLDRLCDAGQICRLVFEDGIARYETPGAVHGHYLICTGCSRKVRIEECPLSELSRKLEQETGLSVRGHNLQLYGLCPECRKSTETK